MARATLSELTVAMLDSALEELRPHEVVEVRALDEVEYALLVAAAQQVIFCLQHAREEENGE